MRLVLILLFLLSTTHVSADDFSYSSLVQLETSGVTRNGINIADGYILTTAHKITEDFLIAVFHGENGKRMKLRADVTKVDTSVDLCLLRYKVPDFIDASVKICTISSKLVTRCDITGWAGDGVMFTFLNTELGQYMHVGYSGVNLNGLGMFNGKNLIGIQTYRFGNRIDWATAGEILIFLRR